MISSQANAERAPADTIIARMFGWSALRYVIAWIDDRRYMARHRRYLDELDSSGELDGLLEALALTREQLAALAISPLASAELLDAVLARVGLADIDVSCTEPSSKTLEMMCRGCGSWRRCRHWVQSVADENAYREFCPNAKLLDQLRQDKTFVEAVLASGNHPPGPG